MSLTIAFVLPDGPRRAIALATMRASRSGRAHAAARYRVRPKSEERLLRSPVRSDLDRASARGPTRSRRRLATLPSRPTEGLLVRASFRACCRRVFRFPSGRPAAAGGGDHREPGSRNRSQEEASGSRPVTGRRWPRFSGDRRRRPLLVCRYWGSLDETAVSRRIPAALEARGRSLSRYTGSHAGRIDQISVRKGA